VRIQFDGLELVPEFKGNGYVATGVSRMPRALWEAIIELERPEVHTEPPCPQTPGRSENESRTSPSRTLFTRDATFCAGITLGSPSVASVMRVIAECLIG
jgi:hypothetical protein